MPRLSSKQSKRTGLIATLLVLGATSLYMATLSRHYSGDSIGYAWLVENPDPSVWVDPYHLAIQPLAWAWFQLWLLLGWSGGAMAPLQALNALAGAGCVGILFVATAKLGVRPGLAALVAAGFCLCGGLWLLSTEAEFVTLALAVQLVLLCAILFVSPQSQAMARNATLFGVGIGIASLFYLTSALAYPIYVVNLFLINLSPRVRFRQATIAAAAMAICLLVVPAALWSVHGANAGQSLLAAGTAYGDWAIDNVPRGGYALLRTVALYPNLGMNDRTSDFIANAGTPALGLWAGYYLFWLSVFVVPFWIGWRRRIALWRAWRRPITLLGTWSLLLAAFAFYWVPGDISFWLPVTAVWWLWIAMVTEIDIRESVAARPGVQEPIILALVVILGLLNFSFLIGPHHHMAAHLGS